MSIWRVPLCGKGFMNWLLKWLWLNREGEYTVFTASFIVYFRRMFPTLQLVIKGMNPEAKYSVMVDFNCVDNQRYRYSFHQSQWVVAGPGKFILLRLQLRLCVLQNIKLKNSYVFYSDWLYLNLKQFMYVFTHFQATPSFLVVFMSIQKARLPDLIGWSRSLDLTDWSWQTINWIRMAM